jgi:hypothetical protein
MCASAPIRGTMGAPKSEAGERAIPMTSMVANTLKEWKLACPRREGKLDLVSPNGGQRREPWQLLQPRLVSAPDRPNGIAPSTMSESFGGRHGGQDLIGDGYGARKRQSR